MCGLGPARLDFSFVFLAEVAWSGAASVGASGGTRGERAERGGKGFSEKETRGGRGGGELEGTWLWEGGSD